MTSHLIIPDSHAHPDYHNKRFNWLGELIVDLKPDVVINMGDMSDMPSLCSYDKGTKGFEGRRYHKDIQSVLDAQERMFAPIKRAKKKRPRFVMLEGNHEHRIERAISTDAAHLEGIISLDDLQYEDFGWEFVKYNGSTPGIIEIDGIAYAHYFTSGIMGRAMGGVHPAYQLLTKQFMSCTQGHTHTTDYCVRTAANGRMIMGLVAGVYQDYFADFAGEANELWWKGVIFKQNVEKGQYDPQWISMEAIKKAYA